MRWILLCQALRWWVQGDGSGSMVNTWWTMVNTWWTHETVNISEVISITSQPGPLVAYGGMWCPFWDKKETSAQQDLDCSFRQCAPWILLELWNHPVSSRLERKLIRLRAAISWCWIPLPRRSMLGGSKPRVFPSEPFCKWNFRVI